ncbi:ectoine/hydroxyectoine ABC transporter permease subunit EhuC [Nocardiopsis terrae]|uniref:Polar amino acid transport system permease protein n=1 Tax=Nocardiopsis terrae TaxID=372655 RepID=A0ABR9HM24_9ACTN|nr:ectoine/hydroxyectoine ABC transporter permease subunit EhuC [Nocardiopsis terrae]MBE1460072.1 polar amino acid transport system permease protein [Nocardiopsis terrae]GHC69549.1 ectoine/hydroxyectoine ABC transporter permease subunit EhuC [Nocardiopsis terrae]
MEFLIEQWPRFLEGAWLTIQLTLGGIVLAFVLAMFFGILGTVNHWLPRAAATVYVEVFRGIAALVVMYWLIYALPVATGFQLEDLFAAILALGLNVGAYGAEVVRSSINAVPKAQVEATVSLNMSWPQRMRLVVLPQAWAQMLPTFGNLVVELMKATAVVYLVSLHDLSWVADDLRRLSGETIPVFLVAFALYYLIAQALIFGVRLLERRANHKLGRTPPSGGGLIGLLRPPAVGAKVGVAK